MVVGSVFVLVWGLFWKIVWCGGEGVGGIVGVKEKLSVGGGSVWGWNCGG